MMQIFAFAASNACSKQLQLVARRGSKQGLAQLSRLAVCTVTATLINVIHHIHRCKPPEHQSMISASMPEYTTQFRDPRGERESKTQEKMLFSMQFEANLTARRFKVTASSKMHLDLSTASIGAALLGTA